MATEIDHIVDDIWKKFDEDASGTLNLDDTLPFYTEMIANRPELNLHPGDFMGWFDAIDQDHDGTITKDEMKAYLTGINYTHHHH